MEGECFILADKCRGVRKFRHKVKIDRGSLRVDWGNLRELQEDGWGSK